MIINKRRYYQKISENPLPKLQEDERIYLNVHFKARGFARVSNCGFDPDKKLWFTGVHNTFIRELVDLYGINEATSEKALRMLKENTK